MFIQVTAETITKQKIKEAHKEAELYRLLDQAQEDGRDFSGSIHRLFSRMLSRSKRQSDNHLIMTQSATRKGSRRPA